MKTLSLDCWVHGTNGRRTFPVEISRTETVGALREVIKNKKPVDFGAIDADALDLYHLEGSLPDDSQRLEAELKKLTLHDKPILGPRLKLSKLFPESDGDDDERPFIIIKAPTVGASLFITGFCYLLMVDLCRSSRNSTPCRRPRRGP